MDIKKIKKRVHLALMGVFSWRYTTLFITIISLIGLLLCYHLATLTDGFSQAELAARANASSLRVIAHNPLFLPHKILQYAFIKVGLNGLWFMRFVSTLFAAAILIGFYRVLKSWYTIRIAILGTLILASSSWFLHWARLGTPDIMYAHIINILWVGTRIKSQKSRRSTTILAALVGVTAIYIPGFIWLLGLGLIWQRKVVINEFYRLSKAHTTVIFGSLLVGIIPLGYAFIKTPSLILNWLGVGPGKVNVIDAAKTWAHIPLWLAYHVVPNPVYWLANLPLLDVFGIVMLVLGGFALIYMFRLDRIKALFGVLVFGIIVVGLHGFTSSIILAPIFLIISSGVALLLQQWFTVFPNNPFARIVGVTLISCLVLLSCYYQATSYFVAWPHNTQTKQAFLAPHL
jgi:hypothetical protein